MTLPSSGAISFSQIAAELGASLPLTIPSAATRTLSGVASGPVVIPTDFHGKSSVSAAFIGATDATVNASSITFSSASIGAADSSRRVIVAVHWITGSTAQTLSSATIGGVSATIHQQSSHSGGGTGLGSAIISAAVSAGTAADISLTFSGTVSYVGAGVTRAVGLTSGTPHATQALRGAGITSVSGSISVPANGILVMVGTGSTNTTSSPITFTGGTERYDAALVTAGRKGGTVDSGLSAETRSIGMALTATDSGVELIAASWA